MKELRMMHMVKQRIILFIMIFSVTLLCGCQNDIRVSNKIDNLYFFSEEDTSVKFEGSLYFSTFGDILVPECEININFVKVAELKQGILYQLKIDSMEDLEIPEERLSIGYFYVQEDKIIRIWESDDNVWGLSSQCLEQLISEDKIPPQSEIVCQETEIEDSLAEGEEGWHQYLVVNGDRREFHSYYQHPQHSGYWESFTWEKGVGLIFYQSGYRDGVDFFKLKRIGIKDADVRS